MSGQLDRGQLQHRAVRGALWTFIHTAVSLPLAFGVNILVARVLGVADYGRLAYLTTVINVASVIAALGVSTALVQFGSKAHAAGRTDEVRRLLSGAQGFRLLVSGPVVAVVVLAVVHVDWWLMAIALLFGIGAPAFLGGAREALTLENRTDRTAQLTMVGNLGVQLAVVAAVLVIGTADAVWSARLIVNGLMLALPLVIISAHYRGAVLRPTPPWRLPKAFWVFALPTGAAGVVGALVSDRTELVALDWLADERAMGLFGLAFGLAGHVYAPAQAFIGPLVPAISGLAAVDEDAVRGAFLRTTRVAATVGGAVVATVLPALALLVPVIYGSEFAAASDMLVVLGVAGAALLISSPHFAFLMARLGGRRLLGINLVSLAVKVALVLLLIPFVGAWGAVAAAVGAMVATAVQLTLGEARALSVSTPELLRSVGPLPVGATVTLVLWLGVRWLDAPLVWLAPGVLLAGGLTFITLVRLSRTGLTQGDTGAVLGPLPRRLRGPARAALGVLEVRQSS